MRYDGFLGQLDRSAVSSLRGSHQSLTLPPASRAQERSHTLNVDIMTLSPGSREQLGKQIVNHKSQDGRGLRAFPSTHGVLIMVGALR